MVETGGTPADGGDVRTLRSIAATSTLGGRGVLSFGGVRGGEKFSFLAVAEPEGERDVQGASCESLRAIAPRSNYSHPLAPPPPHFPLPPIFPSYQERRARLKMETKTQHDVLLKARVLMDATPTLSSRSVSPPRRQTRASR